MIKRVLVTGYNGYIGSVLTPLLHKSGYQVVGLDAGYFQDCTLGEDVSEVPALARDVREIRQDDLEGFDAVVHLAALSNDPVGNLDSRWTWEINCEASIRLAEMAKVSGVKRFLLSSSCIMYGMSETHVVNEESPLDPRTDYARSKVVAERVISSLAGDGFSPVFLRNGTIYGLSPRMRFDTVFNDLMGNAVTTGRVVVLSDGKPWRPVIHVHDVARAFMMILKAPVEKIHNQAFNVGANHLNYRIRELAEIAARTVPGCRLEIQAQPDADQRTYKASFDKFAGAFPHFQFEWTAESGARGLYRAFRSVGLTYDDLRDRRFTRLQWLRYLLQSGRLDGDLRWNHPMEERAV